MRAPRGPKILMPAKVNHPFPLSKPFLHFFIGSYVNLSSPTLQKECNPTVSVAGGTQPGCRQFTRPPENASNCPRGLFQASASVITKTVPGLAHVHDMDVRAQPDVVGYIPTHVIRVFIDHNLIRTPKPVIAEIVVIRGHTEIEASKPKSLPISAFYSEDVGTPEASCEPPMLPRMVEMIMYVVRTSVVSDPLPVGMDVGSIGVPRLILKAAILGAGARGAGAGFGPCDGIGPPPTSCSPPCCANAKTVHASRHGNSPISFFIPDELRGHHTLLPKPHCVRFCKENSRF
jgi:hypothetical protein